MILCKICKKELPKEAFYMGRAYQPHICRFCISKRETIRTMQKRKIKFSNPWFRRRFDNLKYNAKGRGKDFNLTFDDFKKLRTYKNEKCFYCGTSKVLFSTERLDNNKGYSLENCVVAYWRCNKMKSKDFTMEEMEILGKALNKIDKARSCNCVSKLL